MNGTIISGFPGIGKTTISKKYPNEVIDIESSDYKWVYFDEEILYQDTELIKGTENRVLNPNWPNNYLEAILLNAQQYKYVLIVQGEDIRNLLDAKQLDYLLAFPSIQCKSEYVERYRARRNNEKFINQIEKCFDIWIENLQKSPHRKIIIKPGHTLEDEMLDLGMIGPNSRIDDR